MQISQNSLDLRPGEVRNHVPGEKANKFSEFWVTTDSKWPIASIVTSVQTAAPALCPGPSEGGRKREETVVIFMSAGAKARGTGVHVSSKTPQHL